MASIDLKSTKIACENLNFFYILGSILKLYREVNNGKEESGQEKGSQKSYKEKNCKESS